MEVPVVRWVAAVFVAIFGMLLMALPITTPVMPGVCLALGLIVCSLIAVPNTRRDPAHRGGSASIH